MNTGFDASAVALQAVRAGRDPVREVLWTLAQLGEVSAAELAAVVEDVADWLETRPRLEQLRIRRGERLVVVLREDALDSLEAVRRAAGALEPLQRGGSRTIMVDAGAVAKLAVVARGAEVQLRTVALDDEQGDGA
jgi:hypothetical protein